MTVAVVLIDCQNEFAKPGGKHHDDVSTIMLKNNMLENIQGLVAAARENGALIIHSTSLCGDAISACRSIYNLDMNLGTSNTWNVAIVDELQPLDSDIVLTTRSYPSALRETELGKNITERGVEAVILLGFLSDIQVVNTAIDLSDKFPDVRVVVCSDGIASTQERHVGAIKKTLPLIGAEVITCNDVIGMFQAGIDSTLLSTQRTETHGPVEKKLNVFEYQSLVQGTGAFIPSTAMISVFSQARADMASEDEQNDPFFSLSLAEIGQVVSLYAGSHDEVLTKTLKNVAMDYPTVLNFVGGVLCIVGLFDLPDSISSIIGLLPSICYLIAGAKSTFGAPVNDLKGMIQVEKNIYDFKQRIRNEAEAYKAMAALSNRRGTLATNSVIQALPFNFVGQMKYIEEEIFSGDAKALNRSEIEMLLLRWLGTSYTPKTLDYVISETSRSNSTSMNAVEFHQFIATDDAARSKVFDYIRRIRFVFRNTIRSIGYLMGLAFSVALTLTIIKWTLDELGVQWKGFAWTWLYFIGTLGFSHMSYELIRDAYDAKQRAKQLILNCLRYAQYYNTDDEILKAFRSNKHMDKHDFIKLLENSDILLSESEAESLYSEIDRNANGLISQEEINHFLEHKENRRLMISRNCLISFCFQSNLLWFVGAVGYVAAYYSKEKTTSEYIGNIVGAVGYFIGGVAYSIITFQSNTTSLKCLQSLDITTKNLLRTFTQREVVMKRHTLAQTLLEDQSSGYSRKTLMTQSMRDSAFPRPTRNVYDEESPNLSYVSHLTPLKKVQDGSDAPEGYLESLLNRGELASFTTSKLQLSSCSSCVTGSVYMYQQTLDSKRFGASDHLDEAQLDHDQTDDKGLTIPKRSKVIRDEQVGFLLYPFNYDNEDVNQIRASIAEDRSKLRIEFPIGLGGSQLSGAITAELPSNVTVQGTVGKPTKKGSMLRFEMEVTSHDKVKSTKVRFDT